LPGALFRDAGCRAPIWPVPAHVGSATVTTTCSSAAPGAVAVQRFRLSTPRKVPVGAGRLALM